MKCSASRITPRGRRGGGGRDGFSLIELSLGIAIMAVIGTCCIGLINAANSVWAADDASRELTVHTEARARAALEREVKGALAIGFVSGYPDADAPATQGGVLVLWSSDSVPDSLGAGEPNLGEIRLLEVSSTDQVLRLWVPQPFAAMTGTQRVQAVTRVGSDFETSTMKALVDSVDFFVPHTLFGGGADVQLSGGGFAVTELGGTANSVVTYRIDYVEAGETMSLRGAVERITADRLITTHTDPVAP